MEYKFCIRCGVEKEIGLFVKRGKKRGTVCTECTNKRNRERHLEKHGNKRLARKLVRESDPKPCSRCKEVKPLNDYNFVYADKGVHRSYCKICQRKSANKKNATPEENSKNKKYREDNKQRIKSTRKKYISIPGNRAKVRKYAREQYHKNYQKRSRENSLQRRYGIGNDEYDEMLISQSGRCAICYVGIKDDSKYFAVDHCHDTGKIRGLLCTKCNVSLGNFDDNIETLQNAISYLKT